MLKDIKKDDGAALIIVMSILSVIVAVIGIIFIMLNAESKMTYNYTSNIKAMQVAEIGADLAINEWIKYINELHGPPSTLIINGNLDVNAFKTRLETPKSQMESKLRGPGYYNTNDVHIRYTSFSINPDTKVEDPTGIKVNDTCSLNTVTDNVLFIDVEGEYAGEVFPYQVKLQYCHHGDVLTYKGLK